MTASVSASSEVRVCTADCFERKADGNALGLDLDIIDFAAVSKDK